MTLIYNSDEGTVESSQDGGDTVFTWFTHSSSSDEGLRPSFEMVRFVPASRLLRIRPRKRDNDSLQDQFSRVAELQLDTNLLPEWQAVGPEEPVSDDTRDGQLSLVGLPKGFGHIFAAGLGLQREYRGLVRAIEETTECTIVRFGLPGEEGPLGEVFRISLDRFIKYRAAVDRNRARSNVVARRVNMTEAENVVGEVLGVEPKKPPIGRHPIIQAMTREVTGEAVLDAAERQLLLQQTAAESRVAAREAPAALGKLRNDLELVSLEVLIDQFAQGLDGSHSKDEHYWQTFFEANVFALQQLFAAPISLYGSQLHLRVPDVHGAGARIADFVLANSVTGSAHVVEIKTPGSPLVATTSYRGSGSAEVFLPHRELIGAVAQVQAQVESVRSDFRDLLRQTIGAATLETHVVYGAVIVGTAASLDGNMKASFSRYRSGLSNVLVITFDEVLERLRGLHQLLARAEAPLV